MYHPRHLKAKHHWLAVAAVLLVIASVTYGSLARSRSGSDRPDSAQGITPATPQTGAPGGPRSASAVLSACASARRGQGPALRAAERSLAQWQVHVGAMNQLVAGKITLAQATRFWARTRVGAASRVEEFLAADAGSAGPQCAPTPAGPTSGAAAACARSVAARAAVLAAARTAIGTWRRHITDMEMLRMGRMSPSQATQMWLANWRKGVRQLDAYHAAARLDRHDAGCPAS